MKIKLSEAQRKAIAKIADDYLYGNGYVRAINRRTLKSLEQKGLIKILSYSMIIPTQKLKILLQGKVDLFEVTEASVLKLIVYNHNIESVYEDLKNATKEWSRVLEDNQHIRDNLSKMRDIYFGMIENSRGCSILPNIWNREKVILENNIPESLEL